MKYKLYCKKNKSVKWNGKWYHPGAKWYSDEPVENDPYIGCDIIGISKMIELNDVEKIDRKTKKLDKKTKEIEE